MNSFEIANFIFSRIEETIQLKQYIKQVDINFEFNESFGNEYIRLSYKILPNDNYTKLPVKQQNSMFKGSPDYTFSLSTHAERFDFENKKLLLILEFKHIYESIMSYALLHLQQNMPETILKVKSPDMWPVANYAEDYLELLLQQNKKLRLYDTVKDDSRQWEHLHNLNKQSVRLFAHEKQYFNITDLQIQTITGISLQRIRSLLILHKIPLKTTGHKTIEKVRIHALKLAQALKKDLLDTYSVWHSYSYTQLLKYLYENQLHSEKEIFLDQQRATFLKNYPVQNGDLLQLKDTRIVKVKAISIDKNNTLNFTYAILKTNLETSERTRQIHSENIAYIIKSEDFAAYISHTPIRHIDLLHKWVLKKRTKAILPVFQDDFSML